MRALFPLLGRVLEITGLFKERRIYRRFDSLGMGPLKLASGRWRCAVSGGGAWRCPAAEDEPAALTPYLERVGGMPLRYGRRVGSGDVSVLSRFPMYAVRQRATLLPVRVVVRPA